MKAIVWCVFVLGAVSAAAKVVMTNAGEKVMLECDAARSDSLQWYQTDKMIVSVDMKSGRQQPGNAPVAKEKRSTVRQDTELHISGVTEKDAGKFTCKASRKTTEYVLLVVSTSVSPSPVLQPGSEARLRCQVKGLDTGLTVQWKKPDGSLLSDSQEVQLNSATTSDGGTWQCVVQYGSETFSRDVTIKVEDAKLTTTSAPVTQRGPQAPGPGVTADDPADVGVQLLGLSWWVWVALGVGCLVSVLLLVLAIILCQRIKRKKRRRYLKVKHVPQPLTPRKFCECNRPTAAARPQRGRRREKPSALPL
ncbi:T-cell surface glycoprotein CD4-like [Salarias fasciatus]|uniref:T-cell surface glycoprotein CD4-like n=1 Tax=Salarias fasciatus TaxID=181472 RepID=A0A672HH92_SALFA|nr:T-cell surface glycoprotein CD4-like [Salarias fasciatus]